MSPVGNSPRRLLYLGKLGSLVPKKTFYLETFGCQMNVHDSEKVRGTLLAKGYQEVSDVATARLVLYNTCSIRDKAEQKVFSRLANFKRQRGEGKIFGVLGCVAQHKGEEIFEQAPHVSLVCGSAGYNGLAELVDRVEAGENRVTGLDLDTDETFDTPLTRRDNPHRAYITIIEGCNKHCAYCVVPFTRGPERSRTLGGVVHEASNSRPTATRKSNCSVRTSTATTTPPRRAGISRQVLAAVGQVGASAESGLRLHIRATLHPTSCARSTIIRHSATMCICRCNRAPARS